MTRALATLVYVSACGGTAAPAAPLENRGAPPSAPAPIAASPSCRAVVEKRYESPRQEVTDPKTGQRLVITETDTCGLVIMPVLFELNSTNIIPDSSIDDDAGLFACNVQLEHEHFRLELVGHAGSDEHDPQALGVARAEAVRRYYTDCGVPLLGITTRSEGDRGDKDPTRPGDDRRVDIWIVERKRD